MDVHSNPRFRATIEGQDCRRSTQSFYSSSTFFLVAIAEGPHPIPSRTRSLSLPASMVLQGRPCGRVERRQIYGPLGNEGAVFIGSVCARGVRVRRIGGLSFAGRLATLGAHGELAASSPPSLLSLASCDPFAGGAANAQGTGEGGGGGGLLGALGGLACPELSGGGSALRGKFTGKASLNVKIGAFVQAAQGPDGAVDAHGRGDHGGVQAHGGRPRGAAGEAGAGAGRGGVDGGLQRGVGADRRGAQGRRDAQGRLHAAEV
jgi:hypothetical protein